MSVATRKAGAKGTSSGIDDFAVHMRFGNPFLSNRVGQNAVAESDVPEIHKRDSDELARLAMQAVDQPIGAGAILWGEAGIGKSHVLARLARWAGSDRPRAHLVYVSNLQAAPEHLARSLLRCVISILTEGRSDSFLPTPLGQLVHDALTHSLGADANRPVRWETIRKRFDHWVTSLAQGGPGLAGVLNRRVFDVLFQFYRSSHRAAQGKEDGRVAGLAVRWMMGDALDRAESSALGFATSDDEEAPEPADDHHATQVIVALCHVARVQRRPVILCLDQVDNVSVEQFRVLCRFLHNLLDAAPNFLSILSGLRNTLQNWFDERAVTISSWDRVAQYEIMLQKITPDEAVQIVRSRLEPFLEPYVHMPEIRDRLATDSLFPLDARAFRSRFDRLEVRPRDVITWARNAWSDQQRRLESLSIEKWLRTWPGEIVELVKVDRSTLVDRKVAAKLKELTDQRLLEPQTLPPDAENMAGLIYHVLEQSLRECNAMPVDTSPEIDVECVPIRGSRVFHLIVTHHAGEARTRTGLVCLSTSNRTSMTGSLRRLLQNEAMVDRVLVVTEDRRPLDVVGKGREYLNQLNQRCSRDVNVKMSFAEYAELDAFAGVIGLARSGDLEIDVAGQLHGVSEAEVVESLHRQRCYEQNRVLRAIIDRESDGAKTTETAEQSKKNEPDDIPEQEVVEFILGRLAITMGASTVELAKLFVGFLKQQNRPGDFDACKERLEVVARRLHETKKIHATPCDGFILCMRM